MKELFVPAAARRDTNSVEVLRVWIAGESLHVSLLAGAWEDPETWGILMADLVRHIANAYEQELFLDHADTVSRVRALFDAELDSPTDYPRGSIVAN